MTDLFPIKGDEPDRTEPGLDEERLFGSAESLDEEGAWAADQLRAYQMAFPFIDDEDAAAVGELARFSMSPTALGLAFATIVLPGMKFRRKGRGRGKPEVGPKPPFTLTIAPERARVTGRVGTLIVQTNVPLVRRSAVRSAGLSLAMDPTHLGSVFAGRGRHNINWREDPVARFTFSPPPPKRNSGTLAIDAARAHVEYLADEVATEPPLPTLDALPEISVDAARALARGLDQASNLPPHYHAGVIIVRDGVALGASSRHIIEYREPELKHFDIAFGLKDARPLKSVLKRFKGALRQCKVEDRLLLGDGLITCSVAMSEERIASFEAARENALAGVKVSLSVARLCESITKVGAISLSGQQMAKFEIRHEPEGPALYLTSQMPRGRGEDFVTSLMGIGDFALPDDCYFDLVGLEYAIQPTKFDAAELYLGSHAAMIVQYRGEASLTQLLAYRTAEG